MEAQQKRVVGYLISVEKKSFFTLVAWLAEKVIHYFQLVSVVVLILFCVHIRMYYKQNTVVLYRSGYSGGHTLG